MCNLCSDLFTLFTIPYRFGGVQLRLPASAAQLPFLLFILLIVVAFLLQ